MIHAACRAWRTTGTWFRSEVAATTSIDASRRITDMNATAPVQNESRMTEPACHPDS
jgi:hypothetical protein